MLNKDNIFFYVSTDGGVRNETVFSFPSSLIEELMRQGYYLMLRINA